MFTHIHTYVHAYIYNIHTSLPQASSATAAGSRGAQTQGALRGYVDIIMYV